MEYPLEYNFPPFFTIQPNLVTREKQLQIWENFILNFFKEKRLFYMDEKCEIFKNEKISRRLDQAAIKTVMNHLIKSGKAKQLTEMKTLIFWRSLEEWSNLVESWAKATGRSVETVWSMTNGREAKDTEFHGIPHELMMNILDNLAKSGKVVVINNTNEKEVGVKFL
eukprot:GHVL01023406.1.p1 GENE.GHVL01023406.1~~GHVL01023406.1.p1  ORF type:complete len:167 (-),score=29.00 GHVL01023406.1:143-643(-)